MVATLLLGGGAVATAAPAHAAKLQWVTMNSTEAQCKDAVKWKLYEFRLKGVYVYGTSPCRWTYKGWEGAIQYAG